VVGADLEVPLVGGGSARYVNLDHAASTPALEVVWSAVQSFLPWYSSVHRGAGFASQVATAAYEGARTAVRGFLGGRPDDTVIFTRNTTDAINLLARSLQPGTAVVTTLMEHHSNLLPWRHHHRARELPVPTSGDRLLSDVRSALRLLPRGRPALLAVTGASNVTGEVWPIGDLAELAHRHGARILVDAAQLAPHRPVDIASSDLDWVAVSGHKLYAPFGSGALVGRSDWLAGADAYLDGGGAVAHVSAESMEWTGLPDRHEGGSPNVVGAFALGVACTLLGDIGMDAVARDEVRLGDRLRARLSRIPDLVLYRTWAGDDDRVGIVTFNLAGRSPGEVAAILSAEHGIGVRSGSFCAHPLLAHLAGGESGVWQAGCAGQIPGAIRASLGIASREEDVDRLADALVGIAVRPPRWTYRAEPDGSVVPSPDDRALPAFLEPRLAPARARALPLTVGSAAGEPAELGAVGGSTAAERAARASHHA